MDPAAPDQGEVEMAVPPEQAPEPGSLAEKIAILRKPTDINDPSVGVELKTLKRKILAELIEVVKPAPISQEVLEHFGQLFDALWSIIIRPPPPLTDTRPPKDEEPRPRYRPSAFWWQHVDLAYQLMLQLISHSSVEIKLLKDSITKGFVCQLMQLYESHDLCEQDALKALLQRLYSKCIPRRKMIRLILTQLFYSAIYEDIAPAACKHLIDFYRSLGTGFIVPLRGEHVEYFQRVVIPLHKSMVYRTYQEDLYECSKTFLSKQESLTCNLTKHLLRYWPRGDCQSQVHFLRYFAEGQLSLGLDEEIPTIRKLFTTLARCLPTGHIEVAGRASECFMKDWLVSLIRKHKDIAFPILAPVLEMAYSRFYWHAPMKTLLHQVRQTLCDIDATEFEKCVADKSSAGYALVDCETSRTLRNDRERIWSDLTERAQQRIPGVSNLQQA